MTNTETPSLYKHWNGSLRPLVGRRPQDDSFTISLQNYRQALDGTVGHHVLLSRAMHEAGIAGLALKRASLFSNLAGLVRSNLYLYCIPLSLSLSSIPFLHDHDLSRPALDTFYINYYQSNSSIMIPFCMPAVLVPTR